MNKLFCQSGLVLILFILMTSLAEAKQKAERVPAQTKKHGGISSNGEPSSTVLFTGTLEEPTQKIDLSKAKIYVTLSDTSLADMGAVMMLKNTYEGVQKLPLIFTFHGRDDFEQKNSYTVSVHIDVNRNSVMDKGDFVTKQSYPVRPGFHNEYVNIDVEPIK